jgi:predicted nuclease of restriction endonuclease-like (RecB) superfamily
MENLSKKLSIRFGRGFSIPTLRRIRQFYLTYPEGSTIPREMRQNWNHSASLIESMDAEKQSAALIESHSLTQSIFPPLIGWAHYLILMRVRDPQARSFYEIETVRENWSTRELERQIGSLLFERLSKSRKKEKVLALAKRGQIVSEPEDVIKDPVILEFLNLEERSQWQESDLEQAIINRLEAFLLELGKGFCFVARQKRRAEEGRTKVSC